MKSKVAEKENTNIKSGEARKLDSKVAELVEVDCKVQKSITFEMPSGTASTRFTKMRVVSKAESIMTRAAIEASRRIQRNRLVRKLSEERGDVPGWVLVVLMTTGLVTAIWTIAAPRLSTILKNSLDAMNGIR
jgi:hypothetical protein